MPIQVRGVLLRAMSGMVVKQPQFTRVEEPTLLCNHVVLAKFHLYDNGVRQ
jgi:hypothetical protein